MVQKEKYNDGEVIMKKYSVWILVLILSIAAGVVPEVFAGESAAAVAGKSRYIGSLWAIVPPMLAIILALITKEVYSSLFIGIILGGCLYADFAPLKVMDAVISNGLINAVKGTAGIFIFLVILGVMVALINKTGATASFGRWARNRIKSRRGAIFSTFFLGILIFIDDYFNCLTVGSVMQPITDNHKISRAKLAYIIDATAAPVCMIAPVSSWAAAVSQYASGTQYSGLEMFIRAIPYNFYSLLTLLFIITITVLNLDFGPMARHEKNAILNGDLFSGSEETESQIENVQNEKSRVWDMIIPILFLVSVCVFALAYIGGILNGKTFVDAVSATDATVALPWGGLLVLVMTVFYLTGRRLISFREAMDCIPKGFAAMIPPILILTLATALKNMTTLLEAQTIIGSIVGDSASQLAKFLPAVIFFIATILAFSTGTSWGTFGILIPIVVGIFPVSSPLLFIGMSACLAGAVCGDHCSPISDTTIMSAAGARCNLISHTATQLPYTIFVAVCSFAGFLFAGFLPNWFVVFPVIAIVMIIVLAGIKMITVYLKKKNMQ